MECASDFPKILVVYYSLTGNCEYVANIIEQELHCDILHLELVKETDKEGYKRILRTGFTAFCKQKPLLKPYTINPDDYEGILFGSPVWAGIIVPALSSFISAHSLKKKQIGLFLCSGSKGSVRHSLKHWEEHFGYLNLLSMIDFIDPIKSNEKYEKQARLWAREFVEALLAEN